MVTIEFTIDSEGYAIEVTPQMGDLDQLYRCQDEIRDRVSEAGYEFVDAPPAYHVIARAHRRSSDDGRIDLGDITGKVDPVDGPETGLAASGEEGSDDVPPGGRREEDGVEVTLVSPDGDELVETFGESQALGAITAAISSEYGIGRRQRVEIYRSRERRRELPAETPVSSLDGEQLFWETTERV